MATSMFAVSQSVLATRPEEQRFRIDKPNSRPRDSLLIGLDRSSRDLVAGLVEERPERRHSFDLGQDEPGQDEPHNGSEVSSWLAAVSAKTKALSDALDGKNLVVVIASAGADAQAAAIIGDVCKAHGVRMTGLVVDAKLHSDPELAATLAQLRPPAAMVVVARDHIYVADMLDALQA
jgi:hypothetical protein